MKPGKAALAAMVVASAACRPAAPRDSAAASLAAAEALFWRDQPDSARTILQTTLVMARARHDSATEARALTWLGRVAYGQGDYIAARRDGEAGLRLTLRWNLKSDLFNAWNGLGLLAWNQGRLFDAESLLTNAARAAAAVQDHLSVGKASGNLGLVRVELGDYAGARAGLEAMLAAGLTAGDDRVEGNALANLAMLDIREGDFRAAVPRLREARDRYQRIHYQAGQANMLGQLATAWQGLGDFQAAFAAADSALSLARRLNLRQEVAADLEVIAVLDRETGDAPAALRRLEEAQAINRSLDLRVETGTDLRRVAEIRLETGQRATAVSGGKDALAIHAAVGAQPERLADLLFLAQADSASSATWLSAAGRLADSLGTRRARADVRLTTAELALAARRWPTAIRALEGVGDGPETGGPGLRFQVAVAKARAYAGDRRWPEAEVAARRAVEVVERIRGSLGTGWTRARFLASRAGAFATLAEILVARGRVEEAFAVSDAVRGRALLEHLAGLSDDDTPRRSLLASFATRERSLRRIGELEQQLALLGDDASFETGRLRGRLRRELGDQQTEFSDALARQAEAPRSATMLAGARVEVTELRRVLAPREALVEYLIGAERVQAFVVTRDAIHHTVLAVAPEDLMTRVRVARDLTGRPGPLEGMSAVLAGLHGILLDPLRQAGWLDAVDRLVIVPHGMLSYLPFAALRDPARGRFLVEDVTVSSTPSAATLVVLRGSTPPVAPVRVRALAPFPQQLPGTAVEVAAIARFVPGAETIEGADATEAAAREPGRQASVLHLATHGVLNPDNPLFSRMDLRLSDPSVDGNDGRLEVHEILGLEVKSSLVYLSGCETGLGPIGIFTRGDDFVTLAQSFLFAGARAVVATLWRISDGGAGIFVQSFYRNLAHADPSLSLALAQRDMIRSVAHSSPYYWAGQVLTSDGAATKQARGTEATSPRTANGSSRWRRSTPRSHVIRWKSTSIREPDQVPRERDFVLPEVRSRGPATLRPAP